jgi:exonuclease III
VGNFNTPHIPIDRPSRQKKHKETSELNDIIDQMDLIDIWKTFHAIAEEYTFFSVDHETFSKIDHIRQVLTNTRKLK